MPKTITIKGEAFNVEPPFAEGHTLTAAQARQLNQTWAEGVRNNTAKKVDELIQAGDRAGAEAFVAEYAGKYDFSMPGTGVSRIVDPVEREARSIARSVITDKLKEQGRKVKDVDPEKLEAKIDEVAATEPVLKLARKRVADKQKVSADLLSGVDIDA